MDKINPPLVLKKPSLRLTGPPENVTLCHSIQIKTVEQFYSAKRDLEVLSWTLIDIDALYSSNADLKAKMVKVLDEATASLAMVLVIPELYLEEYKTYQFRVTFQNIVGQQSYA